MLIPFGMEGTGRGIYDAIYDLGVTAEKKRLPAMNYKLTDGAEDGGRAFLKSLPSAKFVEVLNI
jgi:hypothetical protein